MDTDTRLAEIEARLDAATEGPWLGNPGHPGIVIIPATGHVLAVFGGCAQDEADAEFTAHAKDDIPWLLARLAERDEQIAGLLADEPTLDDEQPGVPE